MPPASETIFISRDCIICDGPNCSQRGPSKRCSRCLTRFYCSNACQKADWRKEHRQWCHDVREMTKRSQLSNKLGVKLEDEIPKDGSTNDMDCAICLEPIVDRYTISGCGHSFCLSCLWTWQEQAKSSMMPSLLHTGDNNNDKVKCPKCRAEVPDMEESIADNILLYCSRARSAKSAEKTMEFKKKAIEELDRMETITKDDIKGQYGYFRAKTFLRLEMPDEAKIILENLLESETSKPTIPNYDFEVAITLAETKEIIEDWKGAQDLFLETLKKAFEDATPVQHRRMWMGISRCSYQLKAYDKAIHAAQASIEMNRHFPFVHKPLALAQKESGDIDAAITTMAKAYFYEAPWDEEHRPQVLQMYKELLAEAESSGDGTIIRRDPMNYTFIVIVAIIGISAQILVHFFFQYYTLDMKTMKILPKVAQ